MKKKFICRLNLYVLLFSNENTSSNHLMLEYFQSSLHTLCTHVDAARHGNHENHPAHLKPLRSTKAHDMQSFQYFVNNPHNADPKFEENHDILICISSKLEILFFSTWYAELLQYHTLVRRERP